MSKRSCFFGVLLAIVFYSSSASAALFDYRIPGTAALAVRDAVPAAQRLGTRAFVWPLLAKYYEHFRYEEDSRSMREAPFRERVRADLLDLTTRYRVVDLFFLAHTNNDIDIVASLPEENRSKIRLVYNTGCMNSSQGPRWIELGVKTYIGHPGISYSPVFLYYFLPHWLVARKSILQVVEEGNAFMRSALESAFNDVFMRLPGEWRTNEEIYRDSRARLFGEFTINVNDHNEVHPDPLDVDNLPSGVQDFLGSYHERLTRRTVDAVEGAY